MGADHRIMPQVACSGARVQRRGNRSSDITNCKQKAALKLGNYRPELDGLRALAIGLVTLNHVLHDHFPGGFVGVDIFFVLSGYLITSILIEESARNNCINLRQFYFRRMLRLMPALIGMLALYATLITTYAIWAHKIDFAKVHLWAAAAAASYLMNWNLALDIGPPGFLTHTWSLAIEEQFYLLWPLILILATRWMSKTHFIMLCVMVLLMCSIWRAYLWLGGSGPMRIYVGFDTRFDNLLIGCLLALVPIHLGWRETMAQYVWLPLTAMMAFAIWLKWDSNHYQLGMIMTAVCSAWILVAALTEPKSRLAKTLQLRPINYLGRISYAYYLWHFPIWLCLGWFLAGSIYTRAALTVAIAVSVAAVSYHWLELPARRLKGTSNNAGSTRRNVSVRES